MQTLKNLLPKKREKVLGDVDEKTILYITKKILTEEYGLRGAENIFPTTYRNKKVFLLVKNSLWMNEVFLCRESIQKRINLLLGEECICGIIIKHQ